MEFNKQVSNPMLIGAMELMKAEKSAEHNNMLLTEIMKAQFLSPATVEPAPKFNEEGKAELAPGTQIHFPMLTAPDGKNFFAAFTDQMEADKWKKEDDFQYVALNFDDYVGLLFRPDAEGKENPAAGFVVNPFGGNVVITKDTMKALLLAREQARQNAKKKQ
ncbi:MAG: SseB family protein [Lachnospiraceae bacterium]|nr:SseB family protein [Lachnospiraceae bacterium]